MPHPKSILLSLPLAGLLLLGCGGFGRVNQGQVVAYDPQQGLVTLISDSNYLDPNNPRFDALPPVTIRIPADPAEMGPAPEPGRLLRLDLAQQQLTVFEPTTETLNLVPFTPVVQHLRVAKDDRRMAGLRFPLVDQQKGTITIYSARQRVLVTIAVPGQYRSLPEDAFRFGDEIRYYYKHPGQALRLMNVTKTDVRKTGK